MTETICNGPCEVVRDGPDDDGILLSLPSLHGTRTITLSAG